MKLSSFRVLGSVSSLAALVPYACSSSHGSAAAFKQPNILFVLADDMGYGDLGCFGNTIIQTPAIDQLSSDGITFTNCYAGASVSSPSRCTLLTGLHTGHSRIRGNMCRVGGMTGQRDGMGVVRRTNLMPSDSTIAHLLSNHGYVTCLVNKWHLDGFDSTATPLDRGFDEFYGWLIREPLSHNYYPSKRWRNREEYSIEANLNENHADHNTDRSTDEAIDFLRRQKENCFFLYLAYNAPHVPLDSKSRSVYQNAGLSAADQSYAALITHMDESIGRVLAELKVLGIDDNTIVIFASDNGGAKAAKTEKLTPNGALRGWKGDLYEGGIRVPMIVRMPGGNHAGSQSDFPCYFPDIFSTIADLTHCATALKTDGVSLLPEIITPGSMPHDRRYLYWEQYPSKGISQAVRWDDWKLIRQNIDKPFELYDLKSDIGEQVNVAAHNPEIVARLSDFFSEAHVESDNWPVNDVGK